MKAAAQSPGHITGFFAIFRNGSTGAGISIEGGMRTMVSAAAKDSFRMNSRKAALPVSRKVLELFRKETGEQGRVRVEHRTVFPVGYGLGISGAGALSLAIALNGLFGKRLSKSRVLGVAKRAEIECGTGLGDVVAEQFGGVMVGRKPYPSRSARLLKAREGFVVLGFFRPMVTKRIIRSKAWKRRINRTGLACMRSMERHGTVERFIECSRKFTFETGLATPAISRVLGKMRGASMSMLGETVFAPTSRPGETAKEMRKWCRRVMVARIATRGACLL